MAVHQPELFSVHPELPTLDRFERLDTLERIEGFMPTSQTEQVETLGLQSVIGSPGGTAKHLAEVIIHQKEAGVEDHGAAARKITRNYIEWALDAKTSVESLALLGHSLEEANPELILDRVVEPSSPGILEFLRYFDLGLLRETRDIRKVGYDPQKVAYKKENGGIMVFAELAVSTWRVHQVRKRLPDAIDDQNARFIFFAQRLVEVRDHSDKRLSAVAHAGLDTIYRTPEVE